MSQDQPPIGRFFWTDLTVADAPRVRDFYGAVIGWEPSPVSMGDYEDFNLTPPGATQPAAGVCHARGGNAKLPAQWLIYVPVENLEESLAACERLGGRVLHRMHSGCVLIQDPAGAVMVICQGK
jgi:predicted enzyme related to lactoylglutathione lyase